MIIVRVKDRDIEKALRQYKYKRSRSKLDRELINVKNTQNRQLDVVGRN
jgi:ribosomal protein S21